MLYESLNMAPKYLEKLIHMPPYQKYAILISVGGFIFGLDTGTIGPVTTMSSFTDTFGHLSSSTHGLVVSSILLGAIASGIFAGNVADIYGRVSTIIAGALIFGIGAALEAASQTLGMLIAGRALAGVGEGLYLGLLMVYVCEIAPARRRGPLGSLIQFGVISGVAAGYFIAFGTAKIEGSSVSWRLPLALHSFIALSFAAACWRLPPSPRWLLAKHRRDEAIATLEELGLETNEFEQMASSDEADRLDTDVSLWSSIKSNFKEMGRVFSKSARRQTALACFLMGMQSTLR